MTLSESICELQERLAENGVLYEDDGAQPLPVTTIDRYVFSAVNGCISAILMN
jgi:hypothetical protein